MPNREWWLADVLNQMNPPDHHLPFGELLCKEQPYGTEFIIR